MSDTSSLSGLSALLCFDIYATNLAFGRAYKPLLDPLGLTYPQYLVLVTLWTQDDQSVGQIGASLGLESSTLTPLIKRLEAAGLVHRTRDAEDERRVRVTLTAEGMALHTRARAVPAGLAASVGIPQREINDLRDALARLRQALQDLDKQAPCV